MSQINNYEPYRELANAIIARAASDYCKSTVRIRNGTATKKDVTERDACLEFFRSGWFSMLTNIDPEALLHSLDREIDKKK